MSLPIYAMKLLWLKFFLGMLMVALSGAAIFLLPDQAEAYQEASTATGIFVTVTYIEPINVRGGPSTVYYPIVGRLSPGDMLPALGVSPGHEWVEVSFPAAPGGVGWVYAIYVTISGGELQIVEAPPTPTLLATNTIDPTFAAAFNFEPTSTRMPTFTPPPPLDIPQFSDTSVSRPTGIAIGAIMISLGVIGIFGLIVSFILRR